MKSFMRRVDRFCYTHPNFGIPNLMMFVIIGNVLVWLFGAMDTTGILVNALAFSAEQVFLHGQVWRLVTFIFIPTTSGIWLLFMLYFYYFIGRSLEGQWGPGKFTVFYLCGMAFNILYATLMWLLTGYDILIDANYLNLSLFIAFATLFPEEIVLLFFIIPIKMKWLGWIDAAYFGIMMVIMLVKGFGLVSFLPLIAILNYLLFCGGWLFDFLRPARVQQKSKTINYKKAAKQYYKEQAKRPYTRKCEVCGKTDADYPDLEFRFCSRCAGYHCFCIDHINSHVHFKE